MQPGMTYLLTELTLTEGGYARFSRKVTIEEIGRAHV